VRFKLKNVKGLRAFKIYEQLLDENHLRNKDDDDDDDDDDKLKSVYLCNSLCTNKVKD
jgi:hypothetical protein